MSARIAIPALLMVAPATAMAAPGSAVPGPLGTLACLVVTVALVIVTVLIHYGGLNLIVGVCDRIPGQRRVRVAEMVMAILMLHLVEIMLFAGAFRLLAWNAPGGALGGAPAPGMGDYLYYAATVYTTVGFGDLVPQAACAC